MCHHDGGESGSDRDAFEAKQSALSQTESPIDFKPVKGLPPVYMIHKVMIHMEVVKLRLLRKQVSISNYIT